MALPLEIRRNLPEEYDCVLIKTFCGQNAIPVLLDHNLFGPSYTALLDADASSSLLVFNAMTQYFYRQGVVVSGRRRYSDFVTCSCKTRQHNRLIILAKREPRGHVCHCGGEFCIQRILHASSEKEDLQREFVDRVVLRSIIDVVLQVFLVLFCKVNNEIL